MPRDHVTKHQDDPPLFSNHFLRFLNQKYEIFGDFFRKKKLKEEKKVAIADAEPMR